MIEILKNLLMQVGLTIGLIFAFGLAIKGLNKLFYELVGRRARKIYIATGAIGTPIHECGHALFCLLFGHKIVDIKLFQPKSEDGTLGYVKHTYNRKNLYHQIGNFFIGVGPILLGTGILLLLMYLLLPSLLADLFREIKLITVIKEGGLSFEEMGKVFDVLLDLLIMFFSKESLSNPLWWLFIFIACSIALHMSISVSDIKSSLVGIAFITTIMLILNVILYFIDKTIMWTITGWSLQAGSVIINLLMISILLSIVLVASGIIIRIITLFKK